MGPCLYAVPCSIYSVPQSSHLGALLFNLWMNDIRGIIFVIFLMSVDDMKVFYGISTVSDCMYLQRSLINIDEWSLANSMELNVSKCVEISLQLSP